VVLARSASWGPKDGDRDEITVFYVPIAAAGDRPKRGRRRKFDSKRWSCLTQSYVVPHNAKIRTPIARRLLYGLDRGQLIAALEGLLCTKELVVDRAEIVWKALRIFQTASVDFADCLIEHSAAAVGCERTMTFDRGAAKSAGMTLLA
jgi:predicted nucleic-acid-binding protein